MKSIKETDLFRFPKFVTRIQNIGITENLNNEQVRVIILVNTLALVTGATALIIAPLMAIILDMVIIWKAGWVEMTFFFLVFVLNYKKRYFAASVLMLVTQNLAILYFGVLFGFSIPVQMLSLCFANAGLFIFREQLLRNIAVMIALFSVVALGINAQYHLIPPPQSSVDNQNTIYWFALGIILPLNYIISLFYVTQNDQHRIAQEQANAFKTIFVSHVAHELRNVLNAIVCIGELQKRQNKLNKESNTLVDLLSAATNSMRNIINNVIDISEIEAGKMDAAEEETFIFRNFLGTIITLNEPRARKRNLNFDYSISPNVPQIITADTLKLNVIVTNLISNAIKYADPSTTIAVKANIIGDDNQLYLTVTNKCPDIPIEKQAAIFERFFTNKSKKSTEGAGLGLYITHNKVISLGGEINLSSANGLTSFTVRIPFKVGKAEDIAIESSDEDIDLSNINILLADDNELSLLLVSRLLTLMGCTVTKARTGREVLSELANMKISPELIILDSHMPELTGEQTVKALKDDPLYKNIPVIISTGDTLKEAEQVYRELGVSDYLIKPIDPYVIQRTIKKYVGH